MRRHMLFLLLLTLLIPVASAAELTESRDPRTDLGPPMQLHQARQGTLMLRTTQPGLFLPAPTLDTHVTIGITGLVSRARVEQRFHNPTDGWVEGIYVFPLPDGAAVDQMRMIVGERVIVGEIHEREEAEKIYEQAKSEGKKTSLVSQERPNVFTTAVANLGPDEEIEIVIEYQEDVRYDQGTFQLRFPMVVAPRYIPGDPSAGQVPDAERVTPPVASPGQSALNPVTVEVRLDVGLRLARLESPSHAVEVADQGGGHYLARLDRGTPANKDFILEWEVEAGSEPRAALFTQEFDGETYHLVMVLPPHGSDAARFRVPRETIFIIDTSGSMDGTSIVQAREALLLALDHLRPGDYFNVIQFNSTAHRLFPESRPADPAELAAARRYVRGLRAGGGTEMMPALELALENQDSPANVRQVIFATDGSVGNEDVLLRYIEENLQESRLFTVGIGSAPNSYFMKKAAQFGRGTFTLIGHVDQVREGMRELFGKLDSPVLHDIELRWDDPTVESWPERIGDLYLGEPVLVVARLPGGGSDVRVSGWRDAQYWEMDFEVRQGAEASGLDKLWARKKIAALMDGLALGVSQEQVREDVLEVALRHHLVSKYTSLVAVDHTPTAPEGVTPEPRPLPVELPEGWSQAGGGPGALLPQGATPAPLRILLGIFLIIVAWRMARRAWSL